MATRRRREKRRERTRGKTASARRRAEAKSGFTSKSIRRPEGIDFFSIDKPGTKRIEIIPYELKEDNQFADAGELYFEKTFYTHPRIGANQDTYVCPKAQANKRCPICEFRSTLPNDTEEEKKLVGSLYPKQRQLFLVYDLDDTAKGLQLWDVSFHLFGKQLNEQIDNSDEDDGYDLFHDPEDGLTLRCLAKEKSFNKNKFFEISAIDFRERKKPIPDEILDHEINLDELVIVPEYKELKKIFEEGEGGEPEEDNDDQEETSRKRRRKRQPEAEEDDEQWDDEDEPPRRKKRRRPPAEEGAPRRTKRKRSASTEARSTRKKRRRPKDEETPW